MGLASKFPHITKVSTFRDPSKFDNLLVPKLAKSSSYTLSTTNRDRNHGSFRKTIYLSSESLIVLQAAITLAPPSGQLTAAQGNPRSTAIRAVAKANDLELEIVETEPAKGVSPDYLKINKLGKVPTFVGSDGYVLTECIAIAIYRTYFLIDKHN